MVWSRDDGAGAGQAARLQQVQKKNTVMVNPMILRTVFVIALLMALGGVLSACGFSTTFNYGHGQGACENEVDEGRLTTQNGPWYQASDVHH